MSPAFYLLSLKESEKNKLNTPYVGDRFHFQKVLENLYEHTNVRCKNIWIQELKEKKDLENFYILSIRMYSMFSIFNPSLKNTFQFFIYAFDKKHKDLEKVKVLDDSIDIVDFILELVHEFYQINQISLLDSSLLEFYNMLYLSIEESKPL